MPFSLPAEVRSAAQLVEYLADPHRSFLAYQQLIGLGTEASAAARAGLRHENPRVRRTRRDDLPPEGGPPGVTMTYGSRGV